MSTFLNRLGARFQRFLERPATVDLKRYESLLAGIEAREKHLRELSDEDLTGKVRTLRREERPFADDELVEVYALAREAARRALDERPFDVQLLGAMGMLAGRVVQMATGEGKTLAGALAAAGFVLSGKRVHIISVNDYLARRDAEWMRPVYELLGMSVGWVDEQATPEHRREAYTADVCYGSVSEIGFDVLRDRLCTDLDDLVTAKPKVAIVDEADSVLVDEATVPLVLAGAAEGARFDASLADLVRRLRPGVHYQRDEDGRNAWLTPAGARRVEKALEVDLYSSDDTEHLAAVNVALHAHALLQRDVDYIVRGGKVELINTSRGRIAALQRWPDGLQAAVEAKEAVAASETGEVLDSMTVQELISRYPVVCGMTGTAVAVAEQLREFYRLPVAIIPPNKPCVRVDEPDRMYDTLGHKEAAIVAEIVGKHADGRPILVGTRDVAESERIAAALDRAEVPCVVLNAKNDAHEAAIVADAGKFGAVTVSTQMAGRGTDIRLGGADGTDHDRVAELGGLFVLATGRYPSSRLDDQLRGRAGRQGDPGGSVVFSSLDDDQVAQYAPELELHAESIEPAEDGRVEDTMAQKYVEHAQRVAEGVHLEIHRETWRYTQLLERQRGLLMKRRDALLTTNEADELLAEGSPDRHAKLADSVGEDVVAAAARQIVLYHLDRRWVDHLGFVADVRETIHLRALGKQTPIDEFHRAVVPAFNQIVPEALEQAKESFEAATITSEGLDAATSGVTRPTSTWTYMVHDNPFGTEAEQALKKVRAMVKRVRG